jgi:acetyl-CoA carboxylase carboxyltransferase component
VFLRKAYGLGPWRWSVAAFAVPDFAVAWPTGEFGGMGLEGAVRLGYRKELDAVPAGEEREALFNKLLGELYDRGRATGSGGAPGNRRGHRSGGYASPAVRGARSRAR